MAPTPSSAVAQNLLDAAAAALDAHGHGAPARQELTHGRPAWEVCEQDMLAVWTDQRTARQSAGGRGGRASMAQVVVQWRIELVRCVPGSKAGGRAPTADELTASAKGLLDDQDAIEAWVIGHADDVFGRFPSVSYGTAVPLGPLGYVAGWAWPLQAGRQ